MKYCPYCGGDLLGGAVSFCVECGESLAELLEDENTAVPQTEIVNAGSPAPGGGKPRKRRRPPRKSKKQPPPKPQRKKRRKKKPKSASAPTPDPRDIDYDGYYDDVQPEDDGFRPERLDPEVVKRIAFIIAGAFAVVALSVVIMYVL